MTCRLLVRRAQRIHFPKEAPPDEGPSRWKCIGVSEQLEECIHSERSTTMIPLNQEFIRDVLMPVAKSSRKVGKDFRRGRLHTFRHYFCSRLVANGFSELEIRMLMGHSISGMVAHDSHQDDPAVSERFARLPSLVNRKAVPDEPFRRQAVKENSTEERTSESPPETRKKRSEVKQGVAGGSALDAAFAEHRFYSRASDRRQWFNLKGVGRIGRPTNSGVKARARTVSTMAKTP